MNLATVIVLLVVLALVVVAFMAMRRGKGTCDCGGNGKKTGNGSCAGCTVDCPFRR